MHRERLRTKTGCLTCRQRKKKCDENKPICLQCSKLRRPCTWTKCQKSNEVVGIELSPYHLRNLGEGDSETAPTTAPASFEYVKELFVAGQALPTLSNHFASAFDEHVMIQGVFCGWPGVCRDFALDPQWQYLIQMDNAARSYGGGGALAGRVAALWYTRILTKHFAIKLDPEFEVDVPSWLIPRGAQLEWHFPVILNYLPWPAMRELMIRKQNLYCNRAFFAEFNRSWHFTWPFEPLAAIGWDSSRKLLRFSPEFRLRVGNIRSWTVDSDLLARFPEFRGRAPQTEASVTTYHPSNRQAWEHLYWYLLKQRQRQRQQRRQSALKQPRSLERMGTKESCSSAQPGTNDTRSDGKMVVGRKVR